MPIVTYKMPSYTVSYSQVPGPGMVHPKYVKEQERHYLDKQWLLIGAIKLVGMNLVILKDTIVLTIPQKNKLIIKKNWCGAQTP